MNDLNSDNILSWWGEILTGVTVAVAVTGGWFNDRMRISSAIAEIREQNAVLETKIDMMIDLYKNKES